jgi:hypothetical protein
MKKILAALAMLAASSTSLADTWTQELGLVKVEPHVTYQGGIVRVVVDATVNTSNCGNGAVLDFVFTSGTQELRSSLLSALYMAVAANKRVLFYLSSSTCSPVGTPVIVGMQVLT